MMEKMMEDMFNMEDVEQIDEPDMKKGLLIKTQNIIEPINSTR